METPIEIFSALKPSSSICLFCPEIQCCFLRIQVSTKRFYFGKKEKKTHTHLLKRVGHVIPGVVVNPWWAGCEIKELISVGMQVPFHLLPRC